MQRWKLVFIVVLALSSIGAAGYFGYFGFQFTPPEQAAPQATPPPTVAVSKGDVRQLISAPGSLVGTQ